MWSAALAFVTYQGRSRDARRWRTRQVRSALKTPDKDSRGAVKRVSFSKQDPQILNNPNSDDNEEKPHLSAKELKNKADREEYLAEVELKKIAAEKVRAC